MQSSRLISKVVLLFIPLVAGGCDQFSARIEFKKGNAEYKGGNYRGALDNFQRGLSMDPSAKDVWRSVGLSAMALYRAGDDRPDNVALAKTATEAFERYLAAKPNDEKVREYLLMTLLNANLYDRALAELEREMVKKPDEPQLLQAAIGVLIKAGRFEDASKRLERAGPRAPATAHYTIGVACWDKAYRDPMLDPAVRLRMIETGEKALNRAVTMDRGYAEAMVYLGLLARERAKLEPDPEAQQLLYTKAEEWRTRASEILKQKRATAA